MPDTRATDSSSCGCSTCSDRGPQRRHAAAALPAHAAAPRPACAADGEGVVTWACGGRWVGATLPHARLFPTLSHRAHASAQRSASRSCLQPQLGCTCLSLLSVFLCQRSVQRRGAASSRSSDAPASPSPPTFLCGRCSAPMPTWRRRLCSRACLAECSRTRCSGASGWMA